MNNNRKPVACKDGSWTFYNELVGEAYHTPLGAALEAREKFAAAVGLEVLAKKGRVVILDVCYGLGYNTAAALERIHATNPSCEVVVYGLESDRSIVVDALRLPFPFAHKEVFSALASSFDEGQASFVFTQGNVSLTVLVGDARVRVAEVAERFDVVFFDPFSPSKQPEMWSDSFLRSVRDRCAPGAVLVTYSCARKVRESLASAGFLVEDGPVVGRRGPATLGRVAQHS